MKTNGVYTSSVRETHQIAEAQQEKNAKLREAFGISEFFVEGSSLDPERHAREAEARAAAAASKVYELVRTPSPAPPPPPPPAPEVIAITTTEKKKRKRSGSAGKKKKAKKHKRERYSITYSGARTAPWRLDSIPPWPFFFLSLSLSLASRFKYRLIE